jgi:hypothetical protein
VEFRLLGLLEVTADDGRRVKIVPGRESGAASDRRINEAGRRASDFTQK